MARPQKDGPKLILYASQEAGLPGSQAARHPASEPSQPSIGEAVPLKMVACFFLALSTGSHHNLSRHTVSELSHRTTTCHITSHPIAPPLTMPHDITTHHIKTFHITTSHAASHHNISQLITSYRSTSCYITSHHNLLRHSTLDRITSHHNLSH